MKIFIDTNVLISAILFTESKPAFVLNYVFAKHTPIISTYTISECQSVFERKFPRKIERLRTFLHYADYQAYETPETIDPSLFPPIRDISDLPILASAVLSDADILLTGDKDFQCIEIKRPLIFTPAEYYELISQ
ncbi:MAG: putative toxin-antitoxin system toxin component, PIN family [Desulfonatronovibrio sp.]